MKSITTKLKRCKITMLCIDILFLPLSLALLAVVKLGEFANHLLDILGNLSWMLLAEIAKIFKFDEVAEAQYQDNKEKFM